MNTQAETFENHRLQAVALEADTRDTIERNNALC